MFGLFIATILKLAPVAILIAIPIALNFWFEHREYKANQSKKGN